MTKWPAHPVPSSTTTMFLLIHAGFRGPVLLGAGFAVRRGAVRGAAVPAGGPAVGGPQPGELRGGVGGLPRVWGQSQPAAGQVGTLAAEERTTCSHIRSFYPLFFI